MDKLAKKAEKLRLAEEKRQRKEGERLAKKTEKDQKKVDKQTKLRDRKATKSSVLPTNAATPQSDAGVESPRPQRKAPARLAPEVPRDLVTPTKRIGSGIFGDIVSVLMKKEVGEPATATAIFLKPNSGLLAKQAFLTAASQCAALGEHPGIVSVLFQCVRTDPAFVLTEPAFATLKTELVSLAPTDRTAARISVAAISRIMHQLSEGVLFLHENEYYHPDLGARAVHFASEHRVAIKLLDIDRELHADDYCSHPSRGLIPTRWMAPESLVDDITTPLTMVWMFGVLFWEVFSFCARPYANVDEADIVATVRKGVPLDKPIGCPDAMYYMMLGCWDLEMADRPSCERLQNFLKSFPLEEHENTYQTADVNEPIQHGAPACEPGCELESVVIQEEVPSNGSDTAGIKKREDRKGSVYDGFGDAPTDVSAAGSVPPLAEGDVAPESTLPPLVPDATLAGFGDALPGVSAADSVPPLADGAAAPESTPPPLVPDDELDGFGDAPPGVSAADSVPPLADGAVAPESTPSLVPDDAADARARAGFGDAPPGVNAADSVPPLVNGAAAPESTLPPLVSGDAAEALAEDEAAKDDLAGLIANDDEASDPPPDVPDAQGGEEDNDYDCVAEMGGSSGGDCAGVGAAAAARPLDGLPSMIVADAELSGSGGTGFGGFEDEGDWDVYPGTVLKRYEVPATDEDWSVVCPGYLPPRCAIGEPTDADDIVAVKWNAAGRDDGLSNRSLMGEYKIDPEFNAPLNPMGRIGFSGRGNLPRYGPNQLCCSAVSRWRSPGQDGAGKKVLEFVVGRSPSASGLLWVLPTAEFKVGYEQPACIAQCFGPAAVDHLQLSDDVAGALNGSIVAMFQNGFSLHTGYFHHDHNTDNAWYEVVCNSYHDASGCLGDILLPNPSVSDSGWVRGSTMKWATLESVAESLDPLHYNYITSVVQHFVNAGGSNNDYEVPADGVLPDEPNGGIAAYEYERDFVAATNDYATFNDAGQTLDIDSTADAAVGGADRMYPFTGETAAVGTGETTHKYVAISTMQEVDAPAADQVECSGSDAAAPEENEPTPYYSDLVDPAQAIDARSQPAPEVTPRQGAVAEEEEEPGMYQNERAILEQVKRVQMMQGSLPSAAAPLPVHGAAATVQPYGRPGPGPTGVRQQQQHQQQRRQAYTQQQHPPSMIGPAVPGQPVHPGVQHPMMVPQGPRMPGMHGHGSGQGMMPHPQRAQHPQHHPMQPQPRMMPPHVMRPPRMPVQQQLYPDGYGGYYDAMGGYYDAMGYYYNPQQLQVYAQQYDQQAMYGGGGGGGNAVAAPGAAYGHQQSYVTPRPRPSPGAGAGTGAVPGYLSSAQRNQSRQLRADHTRAAPAPKNNDYADHKDIGSFMGGAGTSQGGVRQRVWADAAEPPQQSGVRQRVWDDGVGSQDPTRARPAMPRTGGGDGIPRHLHNRGSAPGGRGSPRAAGPQRPKFIGAPPHAARPRQRQAPLGPAQAYNAQHSWDNRAVSSADATSRPQPPSATAPRNGQPASFSACPVQQRPQQQQRGRPLPSQGVGSNSTNVDIMVAATDPVPTENPQLSLAAANTAPEAEVPAATASAATPQPPPAAANTAPGAADPAAPASAASPVDLAASPATAPAALAERSLDDMFGSTLVVLTKAELKIESERAVHTKLDGRSRVILNDADDDSDYDEANVELYTDLRDVMVVKDQETGFGFVVKGNAPVSFSSIDKGCAAEVAGLRANDVVVAINGADVWDFTQPQLVDFFRAAGAEPMLLSVKHMTYEQLLTIRERIRDGEIDHLRAPATELHV